MKNPICPNCGSPTVATSTTERRCTNRDCGDIQDHTMPLPDEALMETKCPRCDKWQSECLCVENAIRDIASHIIHRIACLAGEFSIDHNQIERDIDEVESQLVALGWLRQDLQDMQKELGSRFDYWGVLEDMLERTKSGEIIPPKLKD